jgi:glyoxylase-like metal-dependent hydrolase (beta-lactamase superfamily II)
MKPALPTRLITTTSTLKEQGREIQLHMLGMGHTDGDLYTYLPKEKVVVTGDALVDWMPFINDGYPEEWVQSLTNLEKLDSKYPLGRYRNSIGTNIEMVHKKVVKKA